MATRAIKADANTNWLGLLMRGVGARELAQRVDGWVNGITGYGTARDKTAQSYFDPSVALAPEQWITLYEGDSIAARICDLPGDDALKKGFTLERDDDADESAGDDGADVRAVTEALKALKVQTMYADGSRWGRCTGAALVFMICDDGVAADQPLVPERVKGVSGLAVYDRSRLAVKSYYKDKRHPLFGQPEVYTVQPIDGGELGDGAGIHESRFIPFGGAKTSERSRRNNGGFDHSVLQKVYEAVRKFHEDNKTGSLMMTDAVTAVWKMAGFIEALASGQRERVLARLVEMDMGRSAARAVVIDANPKYGEGFEKVQTAFSGISDMLAAGGNYLTACAGMPATVLLGRSPAGMNATGESDLAIWHAATQVHQENEIGPKILRLVHVLTRGKSKGWKVVFPSPWQESALAKATREKTEAERDHLRIEDAVVTPNEVALSADVAETYPTLDRELREAMIEADKAAEAEPMPTGDAASKLTLAPTDAATVVTVNEARASMGLPSMPDPDGSLTLSAYKAKHADVVAAGAAAGEGVDPSAPPAPAGPPPFGGP